MWATIILVGLAAFAAAGSAGSSPITLDYHATVGVPEANRIRRAEEAMDFDGGRVAGGSTVNLGAHPYLVRGASQ